MSYQYKVAAIDNILGRMKRDVPGTHTHILSLVAIATQLRNAVDALGRLQATKDPTVTQGAHDKRVATSAGKLKAQIIAAKEKFQNEMRSGLRDIDSRIDAKVKLKPSEHAQEIRAVFRGMTSTERTALLKLLAEQNRGPELAAIISVPAILTGITPEQQQTWNDQIVFQHARDEFDERKGLLEALMPAFTVADVAAEAAVQFSVNPVRLAEIKLGEDAANAAAQAFSDATTT